MKKNKIAIGIMTLMSVSAYANDTGYNVVVSKSLNDYSVKQDSTLPSKESGVDTSIINMKTKQSDSGDIMSKNLMVEAENGEDIVILSDVLDNKFGTLTGDWSSNVSLSYSENTKDGAEFTIPDGFDGDMYLTLTLDDGNYKEVMKPILIPTEYWVTTSSETTPWSVDNVSQDWTPDLSEHYENQTITQTRVVDLSRTVQKRQERPSTGDTRNDGNSEVETDLGKTESRDEKGLMEYWEATDPLIIHDWTVTEVFKDWTPDASTVYETEKVDQYREVKKERTIKEQEIRPETGDIKTTSGEIVDTTLLTEYQTVDGLLEYWENTGESTCTEWSHDRTEEWLPDASDFDRSESVDQTRMVYEYRDCSGEQYRPATDEYRQAKAEKEYQSTEEKQTVNGTKIDLNDWSVKDTNGNWSVSQDGSYAYQSINGNSTIFESNTNYGNTIIKGKMRVRAGAGDDDYIGLVFGKKSTNDFYMWSWKRGNQDINGGKAYEGHFLAHVTGGVGAINWFMEKDKSGYDALDSNISTSVGWAHGVYYDFEIKYSRSKIEVRVDGKKVLEASGSNFPDGKVGFFNLSQGQVEYYKVTDEPLN